VRLRFAADLRRYPLNMADPNALQVAEERCRAQVARVTSIRPVQLLRDRGDLVPRKVPCHVLQHPLLVGQLELH
jgi:hypothetical protein